VAGVAASGAAYRVLVGKLEGKKPLDRPRLRWEDNIKISIIKVLFIHQLMHQ
jgi:hypothetical protein